MPFKFALTQLTVFHVSVELPPNAMEVGFASMPAAGVCAAAGMQINADIAMNQQAVTRNIRNRSDSR